MLDRDTLGILQHAVGDSWYRKVPVPRDWNSVDRPHVAILGDSGDKVYRFYLSHPAETHDHLHVETVDSISDNVIVEVRHNCTDYRYYRKDGQKWTRIGERRSEFFLDVYHDGGRPVSVELPETTGRGDD